jgi:hypothetical protein
VQHKTTVTEVLYADKAAELGLPLPMAMPRGTTTELPVGLRVAEMPEGHILGSTVKLMSGVAAGHAMYLVGTADDIAMVGMGEAHFEELGGIEPGDEVLIDNSVYLAFQTYHRHDVHPDFEPWGQFCAVGQPIYPQRPNLIGPRMARQGSGSNQSGRFAGKMIIVQTLMDEAAYPWQALWYRKQVERQLGDRIDDQFRLWYVEHAMHTGAEPMPGLTMADTTPSRKTRMVSYLGVLQQALRDVADWVEQGIAPPASTVCEYLDGQVFVPPTSAERRGIQPAVPLRANGAECAAVGVGDTVTFGALVDVQPGGGSIVGAEWDFEGTGEYPVVEEGLDGSDSRRQFSTAYAFTKAGTYFPALRVTTQRQGDAATRHARVHNLGRVRVVVS